MIKTILIILARFFQHFFHLVLDVIYRLLIVVGKAKFH